MARDFDGANGNYLSVVEYAGIDPSGTALTVSCWAYADSLATTKAFLGKTSGSGAGQIQYTLICDSANVHFRIGDATSFDQATSGAGMGTGAWLHAGGVKDGTGSTALKAYLNGAPGTAGTSNRTIQNLANDLLIARNLSGGIDNFDGRIAEVAIWSVALTDAEMASLGKGFSPLLVRPQSLAGYWPLLGKTSPEPNRRAGSDATIVGTAPVGEIPRVIIPRPAIYLP